MNTCGKDAATNCSAKILLSKAIVERLQLLDLPLNDKPRFVDLGDEGEEFLLESERGQIKQEDF